MGKKHKKQNQKKTTSANQPKLMVNMNSGLENELVTAASILVRECPQTSSGRAEPIVPTIVHNRSSEYDDSSLHSSCTYRSTRSSIQVEEPQSDVQIQYLRTSRLGAHLYADPKMRLVVKIEHEPSLPEPYDTVQRIDEGYSNEKHIYLYTPDYEDMEPNGNLSRTTADVEPTQGPQSRIEMPNERETRFELATQPSLPEVSMSNGLPPHIRPTPEPTYQCSISVLRVMVDQTDIVLYADETGLFFSRVTSKPQDCNVYTMLTLVTTADYSILTIADNQDRRYRAVPPEELETYTWEGIPVFNNQEYAVDYMATYASEASRETQDPPVASTTDVHTLDLEPHAQASGRLVGLQKPAPPPTEMEPIEQEHEAFQASRPTELQQDDPFARSVGQETIKHEPNTEAIQVVRPIQLQHVDSPLSKSVDEQPLQKLDMIGIYNDGNPRKGEECKPVHMPNESPIQQIIPYEPLKKRWPEPLQPAAVIETATHQLVGALEEGKSPENSSQTDQLKVVIPLAAPTIASNWDSLKEQEGRPKNKTIQKSTETSSEPDAKDSEPKLEAPEPMNIAVQPLCSGQPLQENPTIVPPLLHHSQPLLGKESQIKTPWLTESDFEKCTILEREEGTMENQTRNPLEMAQIHEPMIEAKQAPQHSESAHKAERMPVGLKDANASVAVQPPPPLPTTQPMVKPQSPQKQEQNLAADKGEAEVESLTAKKELQIDNPKDISAGQETRQQEHKEEAPQVLRPSMLPQVDSPIIESVKEKPQQKPDMRVIYYDWDLRKWKEREPVALKNDTPLKQVVSSEPLGEKKNQPQLTIPMTTKQMAKPQPQQQQKQQSAAEDKGKNKVESPKTKKAVCKDQTKNLPESLQPERLQKEIRISNECPIESYSPDLMVGLETSSNLHGATLDPQMHTNVLSLALYQTLKNKAVSATNGVANVLLHISGVSESQQFKVIDCQDSKQLTLGRPWICGHQCLLDFAQMRISFSIGANQINVPMMKMAENDERQHSQSQQPHSQRKGNALQQPTSGLPKANSDAPKANEEERQSFRPKRTHRKRRNKGKGSTVETLPQPPSLPQPLPRPTATKNAQDYSRCNRVIWLPKQRPSTASTSLPPTAIPKQLKNTSKSTRRKPSRKRKTNRLEGFPTMQIWVPRTLLQMQGYYDGNAYIWLPKEKFRHPPQPTSKPFPQQRSNQPSMAQTQEPNIMQKWISKTPSTANTTSQKLKPVWQPKSQLWISSSTKANQQSIETLKASKPIISGSIPVSINKRAHLLQRLLFNQVSQTESLCYLEYRSVRLLSTT